MLVSAHLPVFSGQVIPYLLEPQAPGGNCGWVWLGRKVFLPRLTGTNFEYTCVRPAMAVTLDFKAEILSPVSSSIAAGADTRSMSFLAALSHDK